MTENIFYFGRKWQLKKLHMSEKSSTFVADLERGEVLNTENQQLTILHIPN